MANGTDMVGLGMAGGGGMIALWGLFGKGATTAVVNLNQFGMSDTHAMIVGGSIAALGLGLVATSGSKTLF